MSQAGNWPLAEVEVLPSLHFYVQDGPGSPARRPAPGRKPVAAAGKEALPTS